MNLSVRLWVVSDHSGFVVTARVVTPGVTIRGIGFLYIDIVAI